MQFHVPQFIEIEDKIVGPLTFKQFIYLIGGAGLCFIVYKLVGQFSTYLAYVAILPIASFSIALAFTKINSKPFIFTVEAFFNYILKSRLYIWKKVPKKIDPKEQKEESVESSGLFVPKLSDSKLKEISWGLDVLNSDNKR